MLSLSLIHSARESLVYTRLDPFAAWTWGLFDQGEEELQKEKAIALEELRYKSWSDVSTF